MKPTVLVVDDDALHRQQLAILLSNVGYQVAQAGTGGEGLELCRRSAPEVVLLDKELPDTDGLNVLRILRQEQLDSGVILLTGFGDIPSAVEAMQLGAENFLTKPYEVRHLQAQIARVVEKVRMVRLAQALLAMAGRAEPGGIPGTSRAIAALREQLQLLAQSPTRRSFFWGRAAAARASSRAGCIETDRGRTVPSSS